MGRSQVRQEMGKGPMYHMRGIVMERPLDLESRPRFTLVSEIY